MSEALFEMAEDVCKVCGAHIGFGVRFLHLSLCEDCREAAAEAKKTKTDDNQGEEQ